MPGGATPRANLTEGVKNVNYILSITLENFQSHKKTTIAPAGPGQLTVIIGPSDSGKTALIRGLKWLAYNSPNGTDFIRVGAQAATVSAIMANSERITRTRSRGGINRYILEDIEHPKPRVFESFGTSIPLEVQQALEMVPISIGDMEFNINLSEQLDGPFLGNATPATARAKVLGKLSGVEEVDHANKTLGTDLYRKRREVEGIRNQIDYLSKKIEEYSFLDELEPLVEIVEDQVTVLKNKVDMHKALVGLRLKLQGTLDAIRAEDLKIQALDIIDEANAFLKGAESSNEKTLTLSRAQTELNNIMSQLEATNRVIEVTKDINATTATVFSLAERSTNLLALRKLALDRFTLIEGLKRTEFILEATKFIPETEKLSASLQAIYQQARALSTRCQALTNTKIELDKAEMALERTARIPEVVESLQRITEAREQLEALKAKKRLLGNTAAELKVTDDQVSSAITAVNILAEKLLEVYREAGTCPLCGSELIPEKFKEVV
jgi:hypothetical protein